MPDYKEMYLQLFQATKKAIDILMAAQQQAEESYMTNGKEPPEDLYPFFKEGTDKPENR